MLWAACSYGLSIVFGRYQWRPSPWWFVGIAVFIVASAYFNSCRSRFAWLLAFGSFFLAGALHTQLRANSEPLDTTILPYADRQETEVTAHVTKDGHLRQNDFGETRQSVDVEAEQIRTASGEIVPVRSGIRLNIYGPRTDSDRSLLQLRKMQGESSIMASACASRPSSGRHATFETLGPSTIAHTWPITALRRWARPSLRTSNSSPDSRPTK